MNEARRKIQYILKFVPDKLYLQICYFIKFKRLCDFKNPKSFNEKLQWLKLYDRKSEYTQMVDKYEVKKYVSEIIGEKYVIPTLGVWDSYDEIDFKKLPTQFVLKCTHDSGGLVICNDISELDFASAKTKINTSLNTNYYYVGREWPYKNVKPRIIAEKYMVDESYGGLNDFKFMCFNGKVKCIFVCSERFSKAGLKINWFDPEWNELPFEREYPRSKSHIEPPKNLKEMISIAEKLSKDIPFVRIDLYECCNKIYFGEMTFFPGNGTQPFNPEKWDYELGNWINLPKNEEAK